MRSKSRVVTVKLMYSGSPLKDIFNELAEKWRKETAAYSTTLHMIDNENYKEIVDMGRKIKKPVLALILEEWQRRPFHWYLALKDIIGKDIVPEEYDGKIELMKKYWLDWGRKEKLI